MQFSKRTHTCGELRIQNEGIYVTLNGWVAQIRDLGGVIFINVRDRFGITQITVSPENIDAYNKSKQLGLEYVVSASGLVQKRSSPNYKLATGEIEVLVSKLEILNTSDITPFVIEEDVKASEELRFKYRYLDLRRKKIADNLVLRSKVYNIVHKYFEKENFVEIETPILMKSTPEGARDYLVPSRIHKGKFYALPQSPQTYKQILMVSGFDKYVQICKCFRDEDLRADRQPEFTQIDIEMSFVDENDVFNIVEGVIYNIWEQVLNIKLNRPFKILTYDQAMLNYGTDKPDLRIKDEMKISILNDVLRNTESKIFNDAIEQNGLIAGIKLSSQEVSRKIIDELYNYIKIHQLGSFAYIKINKDSSISSSISKFLNEEHIIKIKNTFSASEGDTIFIVSGKKENTLKALGNFRLKLAEKFNLFDDKKFEFIWINDFPLFSYDEQTNSIAAEHHPFTMPHDDDLLKLEKANSNPIENIDILTSIRAKCYDLVCNGSEFGSGSIRIHRADIQEMVFNVLNLSKKEQDEKFGFLLNAFRYGAPPHGGFALGYDRIIATLCGTNDIRETIAFPKTTSAVSLMDGSPSEVSQKQLDELGIMLKN